MCCQRKTSRGHRLHVFLRMSRANQTPRQPLPRRCCCFPYSCRWRGETTKTEEKKATGGLRVSVSGAPGSKVCHGLRGSNHPSCFCPPAWGPTGALWRGTERACLYVGRFGHVQDAVKTGQTEIKGNGSAVVRALRGFGVWCIRLNPPPTPSILHRGLYRRPTRIRSRLHR